MATLELRALTVRHRDGGLLLDAVDMALEGGRFGVLYGPDGAGKTALLRAIAGLERAGGDVLLNRGSVGDWPPERRGIGLVFQDLALFEGRTVHDNVTFGLRAIGYPRRERGRRVAEVLTLLDVHSLQDRRVEQLSASERLRVAIARALAPGPLVLLVDEPASRLDPRERPEFRDRLRGLLGDLNVTTLVATSDLEDAFAMADDLFVLDGGRMLQSGPLWRVLHGPKSVRAAELFGYATLIHGETHDGRIVEPGVGTLAYPAGFPLGARALALAHPSALLGVPPGSGLGCGVEGKIERMRAYGPTWVLDLRLGDRILAVRWEWDAAPPPRDQRIAVAVRPDTLRFFNEDVDAPLQRIPRPPAPAGAREDGIGEGEAAEDSDLPAELRDEAVPPPLPAEDEDEVPITPATRPPRTGVPAPPSPAPAPPRTRPVVPPEAVFPFAPQGAVPDEHHRGMPLD